MGQLDREVQIMRWVHYQTIVHLLKSIATPKRTVVHGIRQDTRYCNACNRLPSQY